MIENIYAGPHGSHVPKNFAAYSASQAQADLGFIVVQIDGMGTSNRSKAFHDVAWQNLGDAGFPDRILWHKAVAAKYPWYDISRVGIYGGSAGGQNSIGAAAVPPAISTRSRSDSRLPRQPHGQDLVERTVDGLAARPALRSDSSNVDNATRLQGKLLLVVGELDTNVDPASTMQVANALIKAGKISTCLSCPAKTTARVVADARPPTATRSGSTSSCSTCWARHRLTGTRRHGNAARCPIGISAPFVVTFPIPSST